MADDVLTRSGPVQVPLDYPVPVGTEIVPRSISASFNGGGASGAFVPVLEVIAPTGVVTAYCARQVEIAAGASVLVSWFPGVAEADSETQAPAASGTIEQIASPLGTIGVAAPTGPVTSIDLPSSGVVAGTWGDSTHVPQFAVNTEGVITGVTAVAITGSGIPALLFSSVLGADAASIDTGVNGIAGGYNALEIHLITRTADAAAGSTVTLTFNGDAGAHYDRIVMQVVSSTVSAANATSVSNLSIDTHGSGGAAAVPGVAVIVIPGYALTTFNKTVHWETARPDNTGANQAATSGGGVWLSTAAINQCTVAVSTGANLKAGSAMWIYGR